MPCTPIWQSLVKHIADKAHSIMEPLMEENVDFIGNEALQKPFKGINMF